MSDGESESEDPHRFYRALRPGEDPFKYGLRPPAGADPSKSAATHIRAGSRAKVPSDQVSFTRSLKTAAAWASRTKGGRVASVRVPSRSVFPEGTYYDTTNPEHFKKVFPDGGGTAGGFAKGSQEVVVKGGVPAEYVEDVYDVRSLNREEYDFYKRNPGRDGNYSVVRSRTKTKESPRRVGIFYGERRKADAKSVYRERPREERPREERPREQRASVVYMTQEEYDARYGRGRSDSPKESGSSRSGRRYH